MATPSESHEPPRLTDGVGAASAQFAQHLNMSLPRWKLLKSTLISLLVGGLGAFGVLQGADPTVTILLTISSIALLNGVEMWELMEALPMAAGGDRQQQSGDGSESDS